MKKENFTEKPLSEFTTDDTLYVKKVERGFALYFHIKFIKLEKGMVVGEIISVEHKWLESYIGKTVTSRAKNCYTFSDRCHWFNKVGKEYKCNK